LIASFIQSPVFFLRDRKTFHQEKVFFTSHFTQSAERHSERMEIILIYVVPDLCKLPDSAGIFS
jgi:hypothetical protein